MNSYAQESEEEIKELADKYFEEKKFVEATPLYLRLLSLNARDYNYNYRYGTCLLFNSANKESAFKYLKYAVSGPEVETEAYYYLGRAYHLTYRFNDAIKYYTSYAKKAGDKAKDGLDATRQIQMCKNGKTLISNLTDIVIIKKQQIDFNSFTRIYNLDNIGGDLIVTEEFQSKYDNKQEHVPLIHFPANPKRIFYSSYGDKGENGKDIFVRSKLPDGSWSLPMRVQGNVNTPYDEEYPYMHPDGNYLYYCSTGHNSMGGYDIFRSRYNEDNNSFGPPENLDFAISSPDNDLFYVVDSLNKNAYFASQRESQDGKIHVYQVRVERFPVQIVIIKGTFASVIDPSNKGLEIRVKQEATGNDLGKFKTDRKGGYLVNLPKGGRYEFTLIVDGKETEYRQVIDVPYLKEFKPLKQKISEFTKDGEDVVMITNLFDEEFDDPVGVMAEIIQKRSQLIPNAVNYDLDSLDRISGRKEILSDVGLANFGSSEIAALADERVDELTNRLESSQQGMVKALNQSVQQQDKANKLFSEAQELIQQANSEVDPDIKADLLREAKRKISDADDAQNKALAAIEVAKALEKIESETKIELSKATVFRDEYVKSVDAGDEVAALDVIGKYKKFVKENLLEEQKENAAFEVKKNVLAELDEKKEALQKVEEADTKIKTLQNKIKAIKEKMPNAKKKELGDLESDLVALEGELQLEITNRNYLASSIKGNNRENLENQVENIDVLDEVVVNNQDIDLQTVQSKTRINASELTEITTTVDNAIEKNGSQTSTTEIVSSETIENDYQSEIAKIEEDNLTENEFKERKREIAERSMTQIDKQIESLEEKSNRTPEEDQQLNNLNDTKTQFNEIIAENSINTNPAVTENSEKAKAEYLATIDKKYPNEILELNDAYYSGETTADEVQERYTEYIEELKNEKANLIKEIQSKGRTPVLEQKMAIIEQEIIDIQTESANLDQEKLQEIVYSEIAPNAKSDIEKIENNSSLSVEEKNAQLIAIQKDVLTKVNTELEEVNAELLKSTTDIDLNRKRWVLKNLVKETENEISVLEQSVASPQVTNDVVTNKKEIITEIDNDYKDRLISAKTEQEIALVKAQNVIDIENDFIQKLNNEIATTNTLVAQNPDNAKLKDRLNALEDLKSTSEANILAQQEIIENSTTVIESPSTVKPTEANVLAKVDSDYTSEKASILNSFDPPIEKASRMKALEEKFLNNLNTEISETQSKLNSNPSDENLKEELEILKKFKNASTANVAEQNEIIAASTPEVTSVSKEEVLNQVDNNYESEISTLEKEFNAGNVEIGELISRKQAYANKLNEELQTVQNSIENSGNTDQLIQKKNILSAELVKVNAEIEKLETQATIVENPLVTNVLSKQELIADIQPNYENRVQSIEDSDKNDVEKAEDRLDVENALLQRVRTELSSARNDLEKSPNDESLITKIERLVEIESTTQANIATQKDVINSSNIASNPIEVSETEVLSKIDAGYSIEIGELESDFEDGKIGISELINRKEEYKEKLENNLSELKTQEETNGTTAELTQKKDIVTKEIQKVSIELGDLETQAITSSPVYQSKESLTEEQIAVLDSDPQTIEALQAKDEILAEYLSLLENKEKVLKKSNRVDAVVQLQEVENEISSVKKTRNEISISIGELESETLASANTNSTLNTNETIKAPTLNNASVQEQIEMKEKADELAAIHSQIEEQNKIAEALANEKARAKAQKDIDKLKEKSIEKENELLEQVTAIAQNGNSQNLAEVENINSLEVNEAKINAIEAQRLIEEAQSEKDLARKNYLLNQAAEKQNEVNASIEKEKTQQIIAETVYDFNSSEDKNIDVVALNSQTKSGQERTQDDITKIDNRIEELNNDVIDYNEQIALLSAKKAQPIILKRDKAIQEIEELKDLKSIKEELLAEAKIQEKEDRHVGVEDKAIENTISYDEELKIASSDNYKEISKTLLQLDQTQYEIQVKKEQQEKLLKEVDKLVANDPELSTETKDEINVKLTEITELDKDLAFLRNDQLKLQEEITNRLPEDATERALIENMITRRVTPIARVPLADIEPLSPSVQTGILINPDGVETNTYTKEKPIPINDEIPKGLVYRVQVGAFYKPISNETFTEFAPLSGERVGNRGIIRYVAGLFGSKQIARSAQTDIRALGYKDAFVVAYCDGVRIPLYKAEQLIASGECVSGIKDADTSAVAISNPAETNVEQKVDQYAYNKAPNAAVAEAAESKKGLFFTVQVGVYNRPVTAEQLNNINPLVTLRLPNGQLRYSTGIFESVDAARPQKAYAIENGVSDAFITAYYKGERISVGQARKLLEEFGDDILETKNPSVIENGEAKANEAQPKVEVKLPALDVTSILVQFESKENYTEYPTQVLSRLNEKNTIFYFDKTSGKIKSVLTPKVADLDLGDVYQELNVVEYYKGRKVVNNEALTIEEALLESSSDIYALVVRVNNAEVEADVMEIVLNTKFQKRIVSTDTGFDFYFTSQNKAGLEKLKIQLADYNVDEISIYRSELNQK